MSIARAQTDISHVDNMISQIMSKQNEDNYFNIPGLQQLFYDELLVADKEQALINFEMMLEFNPDLDPALKQKVELIRKNLRKERLRINTEFESIKTNLKEPLEGTPNRASLKEQQQYLDQFVESGKGFTRFNREKIRDNAKLVDSTILELMKEKNRRSDTLEFATEQLTKLSQIKKASQLASWYNDSLTNVEKQLIKNRATRLKELEENRNQLNDAEVEEANELKDALDIPQDATSSEVNKAIGDAISETDTTVDPNIATEATLVLSEDFDFTSLSSNPMVKVVLNNYPLANVRGIKTRIKNGESFVITEVNNNAGYFTVTSNDGKANVKIAIKNGPLDGTTTVGKKEDATVQDKLDDLSASTETPTVSTSTPLDPTPTEVIVTEDIKNIQNTTIDEITNRLQILNSKKFDVNPQDESTYIEVDENGNPVKDENGNVVSYSRVSTLKGAKEIKDKRPANRGTIIDTLLRDFINNKFPSIESFILAYNSHPLKNLTQKFSPAMLKNLFDIFTEFKKSTDVLGIQLISDIPTLWGKLGGSNFAGTIDLMGIAPDGSVYIIDLKTASKDRRAVYNNNDPSDPYYGFYVEGDSLQQSAYAELLRQRTGITVKNLLILPIQTTLLNNEFSSAKPNISSTGKYTIQVGINRAIFPEINLPIEEKTETNIISPEVAVTTTPTIEVTAPAPVSNIEAKKLKLDPDLAKIDPLIIAARNGDIDAQKKLEEYGLEWEQTTTYRFIGQSEVDVLLSNNEVKSKRFVDVGIDVTTSSKVTSAASNDYRVTFKESFDVNNGLGKVNIKSRKEGDHNLEKGKGYSLSDVAKIERLDENGNVIETIYDAELAVLEGTTDAKADIERRRQEKLNGLVPKEFGEIKNKVANNDIVGAVNILYQNFKNQTFSALGKEYKIVPSDKYTYASLVEVETGKEVLRFVKGDIQRESGHLSDSEVKSLLSDMSFIKGAYVRKRESEINAKYDAEYVDAVKKGTMRREQAMKALEEVGRKDSNAYAELAALEEAPITPTPEPTTKKEGIQVTPAEIGTNTDVVVVDAHFERPDVFGEFTNSEIASGTSNPLAVAKETQDIYELGQKLDMNDSEWVIGSLRAQVDGRLIVDVFAEGKRFLMYRSIGEGTGVESIGEWVPMFSFAQNGWFVKDLWKGENPKFNKYESKTFKAIHNYLVKNSDALFTGAPATAENQDIIIDEKYLGKLIYSSSTSGKSTLAKNSQNVIDADDLLKEAILEVEPSGQVSTKEVYGLSIFDKVKSVFFKKIKSALAQNKTVVSANRIVREALPSELTIDYVFLHSDPSEFVKRSVDRPEPFTERSAKGLFESEKNRFKQANFYYSSGVTISDVIKAGSTVELVSIPSVEETSTKDAPIRKRVDSRLSIPYTFYNMIGVRNNVANRDAAIDKRNNFINSTEEQQMNFSVVSTPVNPTMLQKFVDMGLNISKNSIPVEMLFDKNFNPNDLTLEQIAALKNGQPILVAVNNIVTNTIKLGDTTHPLELGSPYRLVLVTPSAPATTEMLSSGDEGLFINNANLSVKFFNPNDYSLDQLSSLLKFNNKSSLATQSEIQAFVKRFNDSVKLYKVLATLPANTPITLANIKDIVTISSTVGEMNLVKDGRFSITELPQSMLYPFGEQAGIIIVDNTRSGRIIQVDKNNISVIQARQLNTMDLGSTFGLKLIIKHPRLDKILYVDIDMPSVKQDQEVAAINLATVLSEQINKIQAKGIDPQINVSTYNAKLENTFGREGLINITSPSLQGKGVFFNLKLKKQSDNTAEFILEVKRKVDGKYISSIIPIEKLLQENPASTNDFIKFLYDNINIPEIKNLFENPNNDFTIGFGGTNIDAIINNATTRLSPTEPFTNSTITATLVNDIESKTLANLSNIKETAVSSLDDFTTDPESGEIDYLAEFETLYNSSKIAITQMLKVRGVKLDTLKNFIKENKIVVNEIDQINDILTKMC
jgi:hypothetical protein